MKRRGLKIVLGKVERRRFYYLSSVRLVVLLIKLFFIFCDLNV